MSVIVVITASAQSNKKRVKLIHADRLQYEKSIVDAQRLLGNVQLEYEGVLFQSDSAYLFKNDDFDAFGSIRVIKGADYTLTGEALHFDQAKKLATITKNVVLRDRQMTLTTDYLTYHTTTEVAAYTGGGTIISSKDKNTLTSRKGYYHSKSQIFYFREKVVLRNPDYLVNCDTLQYHNTSEIAYFYGPTTIKGSKTHLYCENGYYNTKKDESRFGKNARVTSEKNILTGDSIYYNGRLGFGEVFNRVTIRDTTTNYIITGNYGFHNEKNKESFVTKRALLMQYASDGDTLYVHADTLKSVAESDKHNRVHAHRGVKMLKSDLQALCDSMVYTQSDSLIRMFYSPVIWSDQSQITGDSLQLKVIEGRIEKFYVRSNSWIISEALSGKYNQIKGRQMTGYFNDNALYKVDVFGNGQLIYFPVEEKKGKKTIMGCSRGDCSNIEIRIAENKITGLRMDKEPNSKFYPLKLSKVEDHKLEGFLWRGEERPKSLSDLFAK